MGQFDVFVVNVAAPTVQRDLAAGPGALEMVVGGYAFAYAAGLVTGGRLGERYGYRRLFVIGMGAFAGTSLLCPRGHPDPAGPGPPGAGVGGLGDAAAGPGADHRQLPAAGAGAARWPGTAWRRSGFGRRPGPRRTARRQRPRRPGLAADLLGQRARRGAGRGAGRADAAHPEARPPPGAGPCRRARRHPRPGPAACAPHAGTQRRLAGMDLDRPGPVLDLALLRTRTFRAGLVANAAFLPTSPASLSSSPSPCSCRAGSVCIRSPPGWPSLRPVSPTPLPPWPPGRW